MVATAGRGPWDQNGRPYVRLLEPLNDAIASHELRLDAELAALELASVAARQPLADLAAHGAVELSHR
jgi:hypothetical protein